VAELCDALRLPLTTGAGDVRTLARARKLSLEDAARRARYAFLASTALALGYSAVATGHTASDQGETVLLNIIRGAGLSGLGGMPAASKWPFAGHGGLSLLRPLLGLTRSDTLAVCSAFGLEPLEDESNASPEFRRNRVRHEVLPMLHQLNPGIEGALVRLADAARLDTALLDSLAEDLLRNPLPGVWELSRAAFANAPEALRRHALRLVLERATDDRESVTEKNIVALERMALDGKTGDGLDLPGGLRAELAAGSLRLAPGGPLRALPDGGVSLPVPGCVRLGDIEARAGPAKPAQGTWVEVSFASASGCLAVRRRRDGDRFQPLGMAGTKKLQDFFVDERVPRALRNGVPIFESERGIVWVGGLRIAEWAKPLPGEPTLFLSYENLTD
jgi:tRNA(Ile)-lysidine synthase